ncbi:hypothetical protein [Bradyrhizobium sp. USDA 4520]
MLIEQQTITKTRSNLIQAMQLLTAPGAAVAGDGGNDGGSTSKKYWPEDVLDWDFVPSSDKFWGIRDYTISMNSASAPSRKVTPTRWRDMQAKDPGGANWGGDNFYGGGNGGPSNMFEDEFYVYWLHKSTATISRLLKTATNINSVETLVIPQGFYVDGSGTNDNLNYGSNDSSVFRDGTLYLIWNGRWDGSNGAAGKTMKVVAVDITAWSSSAFSVYDYDTGSTMYWCVGSGLTDNGYLVIGTIDAVYTGAGATCRYYYAALSNLSSWSQASASMVLDVGGRFTSKGNIVYFGEMEAHNNRGPHNGKSRVAVIDMTSGFSETLIDLNVQDGNFEYHSQVGNNSLWCSDTHLFVYGNHSAANSDTVEHRYIGRFDLGTLNAASGKYLRDLVYNENDFYVRRGRYSDGKCYAAMSAFDKARNGFLIVSEDLSSPQFYWTTDTTHPTNDDFANPALLLLNAPQSNDLSYGTTESSEPPPLYLSTGDLDMVFNNGHSVWYYFRAPATTTYTITVQQNNGIANSPIYGIAVYTGDDLASLTWVTGVAATVGSGPSVCSLSATADTVYRIAVRRDTGVSDGLGGAIDITGSHDGRFIINIS